MATPHVAPEKLMASLQPEVQQYLQSVMQAVNNAPDGDWLAGSEEQVRNLSAEFRVTRGVREMACRENQSAPSFDKGAENLTRTAQIQRSGEQLRLLVEAEGRRVQALQQSALLDTAWTAADCPVREEGRVVPEKTRVYVGCDGVMVPIITQAETQKRRATIKEKRRKCGQKRRPLPPQRKRSRPAVEGVQGGLFL